MRFIYIEVLLRGLRALADINPIIKPLSGKWLEHLQNQQEKMQSTQNDLNEIEETSKMEDYLVEQSFKNIVGFYKEELLQVDEGKKATKLFNDRQRKSLVKAGILLRVYGKGGCRLKLSEQAKEIIEN